MFLWNINKKGITLVSLVITIVIMLILAGVSISFIIGQNGLFNKADQSAKMYSKEAVKEELQTASNAIYLDGNDEVTNQMIADDMKDELEGLTWQDEEKLVGNYKGYDFYIDENKNVIMEKLDVTINEFNNQNKSNINDSKFYNTYRRQIKNIKIEVNPGMQSLAEIQSDKKWDVSKAENEGILAYLVDSGDSSLPYNLNIESKKKIVLPADCSYLFFDFENVYSIHGFDALDTTKVTNMASMFGMFGYKNLTSLDLTDNFVTSNVTNMQSLFDCCGCTDLSLFNLGSNFDTSKVTTMSSMFNSVGQNYLTTFSLGDKFDTSNVENMNFMFNAFGKEKLKEIHLGKYFDTSKVIKMDYMFNYCGITSMTTLDLGENFDTSNVTTMNMMFYYCGTESLTSLNLGNKFNTSKVTNMQYMFNACGQKNLTTLNLGDKFDTSKVTKFDQMLYMCGQNKLTKLDLGKLFVINDGAVTSAMFGYVGPSSCQINCLKSQKSKIESLAHEYDNYKVVNGIY